MLQTDDIEFRRVDSDFGEKLVLDFGYDEDAVEAMQSLDWDATHRQFHNPEDTSPSESIFDEQLDSKCWHVDCTPEAIDRVEESLGVVVPSDYLPGTDSSRGCVGIRIPDRGAYFFVEDAPHKARQLLERELSYQAPDAQYNDAYKQGLWDGIINIYDDVNDRAPIGLVDRAVTLLEDAGFTVAVDRTSRDSGRPIQTDWQFEHDLRSYQSDAIDAVTQQGGGIISLPTGTGKTVTGLGAVHDIGKRAIIFVHTRELLYQWADNVRDILGIEPGLIGDQQVDPDEPLDEGPVTIAIMDTVDSRGVDRLADDYGVAVFDECHRTTAADTMYDIGTSLDVETRIGLSATPWRRIDGEELKIEGVVGSVAYEEDARDMIRQGYLANPTFDVIDPDDHGQTAATRLSLDVDYHLAFRNAIEFDPVRNIAVAKKAYDLAHRGHRVLVNVNRVAQGLLIASTLTSDVTVGDILDSIDGDTNREDAFDRVRNQYRLIADTDAAMLHSGTADSRREELLEEFETGETSILVSTLVKEGVNIPDISAIVLAHGQKSDIETIQTIGRALRPAGDLDPVIVDVADSGRYFQKAHRVRTRTMERYYSLDERPQVSNTPMKAVKDR